MINMAEDARYKTKAYLEAYDTPANITKDDDTTLATYIYQYEKPPYPLKRIFFDPKNVDGIYTIYTPDSRAEPDWKHENYAYTETVPIEISCVRKQGITGDKLKWKMEAELRDIVDTYPLGSVRSLTRMSPQERDMGTWKLHTVRYDLRYKRPVWDYTSDVAISYPGTSGNIWEYDCNRLSGGVEGTWTLTQGGGSTCTQSVTSNPGFLVLNQTVFGADSYTKNGTNLGISTTTATKIRFRYKTTSSSTAKIVVGDDAAYSQTVLSETASTSTYSMGEVSLTTGKTLDHVTLYNCDGTGTVHYDFVQIYGGDFTVPNVTSLVFEPTSRNLQLPIMSRVPSATQNLGAEPARLEMVCDLDIQQYHAVDYPTGVKWKRTGDVDDADVFLDILHNQSVAAPWQWFVWGNKQCRVTLDSAVIDGREGSLRVTGHEYSDSPKQDEYYYQRWSLDI